MFNKINLKNYFKEAEFFEKLIIFLPISLILGNFALNINILSIILSFFVEKFEEIKFKIKLDHIIIFLFLFFSIFNILLSTDVLLSAKGFLGILKHGLLFMSLAIFFKKKKNLTHLSFIFFVSLNFVLFDTMLQYFTGKDIFGYESLVNIGKDLTSFRLSGPFGDEFIVGGYLKNIFLVSIVIFLIDKKKKLFFYYLSFTLIIIFFSGERSSSVMFCFFCVLIISFLNYSLKKKVFLFLLLSFTLTLFFTINDNLRKSTFDRTLKQFGMVESKVSYSEHKNFFDSQWGAHFLTAYEIFKDNKVIGSGFKNFRVVCANKKYDDINSHRANSRCATHPHNIYLEILSETGIIGLLFFIFIIFKTIKIQIRRMLFSSPDNYLFSLSLLSIFVILFWPLQTTGSFFSTYNGFFYWFYGALIYSKKNYL